MTDELSSETLSDALEQSGADAAAGRLSVLPPGDAAQLMAPLPAESRAELLLALTTSEAASILDDLPDDIAADTVGRMSAERAAPIVHEMWTDLGADLLQSMPEEQASAILQHLPEEHEGDVQQLLDYPDDTAGGLMRLEHIAIPKGLTAGEVVEFLRREATRFSGYPATYLYVIDEAGRLDGVLSLRDLLLCNASQRVAEFKITQVTSVNVATEAADLVALFRRTHFLAVPVVDANGKLLGVVTQEGAMRYAEENAEENMLRMAGIAGGDEFRVMPLRTRAVRRLSWLSLNVLLNVVAASVIALYQDTLQSVIALAVFLPIISDMSGCSGNQAVAVSIRELSMGRVHPGRILWVVGKELSVGLFNGFALGLLLASVAFLWQGNAALGLIVGGALWINTIVAVVVGGSVPLILQRMDRDPALAAGPILTTLTDMCGFFLVLVLAQHFLHLLT